MYDVPRDEENIEWANGQCGFGRCSGVVAGPGGRGAIVAAQFPQQQ
jgi:hypothetical protein